MRKVAGVFCILTLTLGGIASFATTKQVVQLKPTNKGTRKPGVLTATRESNSMVQFKAQNHLSSAMNQLLIKQKQGASYVNGTIDTVPYFNSWFITGSRNSVYTYSMVGHSPKAGGTTTINNELIPLETWLIGPDDTTILFDFDPSANNDPQGSDASLVAQSPLYNATTTYAGPPSQTGQFVDSHQRVSFRKIATANWHTPLGPPSSPSTHYIMLLFYNNFDWTYACCDSSNNLFPVVNIDSISNVFGQLVALESTANSTVPVILTDYETAFDPSSGSCCILGYHTAQQGVANPNGILVWTWATFIANSANSPFGAFGRSTMVLSHEVDELYNDPFVNTLISPWIDGSVSFAQGNLETGDAIEAMSASDVVYNVSLNTTGGPYNYSLQNVPTLEWFTRNPFNGGLYSWPNEHVLTQAPHPVGCTAGFPCWSYGQGSAGFFFGPPY